MFKYSLTTTTTFRLVLLSIFFAQNFTAGQPSDSEVDESREIADNNRLRRENLPGKFLYDDKKNYLFEGAPSSPSWAVKRSLAAAGLNPDNYTGGISPFRHYSREGAKKKLPYMYVTDMLSIIDLWTTNKIPINQKVCGFQILKFLAMAGGRDVVKNAQEHYAKESGREKWWADLSERFIPSLGIMVFKNPKLLAAVGIFFILLFLPFFGFKNLFQYLAYPRPKLLNPEDSDIVGGILTYMGLVRFKFPDLPKVIVNKDLSIKLNSIIEDNKRVVAHNKNKKIKPLYYHNFLLYGPPGTGKTLFCTSLAKKTKMHFIRFSAAELCQFKEEEAIQELKRLFRYANSFGDCLLIIEEADALFNGGNEKVLLLQTLFQKEFSSSTNPRVQVALLTNHPKKIARAVINRCAFKIKFTQPNYRTKVKLYNHHLKRHLSKAALKNLVKSGSLSKPSEAELKDLVGRDFEAIATLFAKERNKDKKTLKSVLKRYTADLAEFEELDKERSASEKAAY